MRNSSLLRASMPLFGLLLFILSTTTDARNLRSKIRPSFNPVRRETPADIFTTSPLTSPSTSHFAPTVRAPKDNIWAPLSHEEATSVVEYLHRHFNLTHAEDAGPWDNAVSVVDLVPPNKTEALSYLDGDGPIPLRWAKASISFGATETPYLQDFAVGPLPLTKNATHWSLDYLTTSGTNRMKNSKADASTVLEFLQNATISIGDITQDLLGYAVKAEDAYPELVTWTQNPPLFEMKAGSHGTEERRTIHWASIFKPFSTSRYPFDVATISPQGIFLKVDVTGRDPSKWTVDGWVYNDKYYNSTESFRQAWKHPNFQKVAHRNTVGNWASTDPAGKPFKYDERVRPLTVYPEGKRYAVDFERKYVEWGAFSFYLGFTRDAGLQLFDIRYNGERIIYHIGLQEAVAQYAGEDPFMSNLAYLDSFFGLGSNTMELVDGYDCPHGSTYLDSSVHEDGVSRTYPRSICVFEQDGHLPLQRHTTGRYVEVTKNIQLVVRAVSTVSNYDYTWTYIFSMDGSIEVKVSASGYIFAAFYAHNEEYGYRIREGLSGSMHDHVLNFKVDIDVHGTKNTFAKHAAVAVNQSYPWSIQPRSTMKLDKTWILNEDEGKLEWPGNGQTQYLVLNKDQTNPYGEHPGYRIMPGQGGGGHHLSSPRSETLQNSVGFAREHLYVTKAKDGEVWSSHPWNLLDPARPVVDFGEYLDGESLEQEDLVLWVNLGMTHIPHTGDLPTTVQTTSQSSFLLLPHNYLPRDPSRRTRQQVRISYGAWLNGSTLVERFGQHEVRGAAFPLREAVGDLEGYGGKVVRLLEES
ncbi:hypothetical protein A4X13_0g2025 [Tilletia indica]|uniref:Amine oxidase n=1 Tax=Tilletia indica TaxID=43049 RepID=A0A177TEW5_9BASI|nr:hypothetical protein A4X13_0g2025 [Tilletia indica]